MIKETERHSIRFADANDLDGIIEFIKTEWNPNHIFVHDVDFFKFEFLCEDRIHFVLAINKRTSQLDGIVGFLKYTEAVENSDVFGAIWKVKNNTGDPMLGVRILSCIKDRLPVRTFSGCGANPKTLPIYNYLGYKTGKLDHYYLLNNTLDSYTIADIRYKPSQPDPTINNDTKLINISRFDDLKAVWDLDGFQNRRPFKDRWYLNRRYFNHPIYAYQVWGIRRRGGEVGSILVTREVTVDGNRALRIIDFIGEDRDLGDIGPALVRLMVEKGYEYIDFYQHGIDEEILTCAGFVRRREDDENIIPNYFEPFVRKNIEIHFFTSEKDQFYMFKGDGDQDRPNLPAKGNQPGC